MPYQPSGRLANATILICCAVRPRTLNAFLHRPNPRPLMCRSSTMFQMSSPESRVADPIRDVDKGTFRAGMRELAGGVAVVTVGKHSDITGFTATSVTSLSAHPPRLMVCVAQTSASWNLIQRYPHFVVNLLRDDERWLANRFSGKDGLEGVDRFAGAGWTTMRTDTPVLENGLAALDCAVEEMLPRYDHAIIIGRVCAVRVRPGAFPLIYWQGDYRRFEQAR